MAYISEIKSKDDPTWEADYIEVVLAPGEVATDFDIVVYLRNGTLSSTTGVVSGTLETLPDGTQIYTLSIQTWEWDNLSGPAAGLTATAVGNSSPGDSHFFAPDGSYTGTDTSTPGAICFCAGTLIQTQHGQSLVEDLAVGDRVFTRDNGYQRIVWIGKAQRMKLETARHQNLRPIVIRKDAFGAGCPSQDLHLSQQHRVLSTCASNTLFFGSSETLTAAKHLVNDHTILSGGICDVIYYHVMFDAHEVIRSNGVWTESFLPSDYALTTISDAARSEFETLFPDFDGVAAGANYEAARYVLKSYEAKALMSEMSDHHQNLQ